jgi:imidazole glycerol phosphate synthase subunit HisF
MNRRFLKLCMAASLVVGLANLVAGATPARANFIFQLGTAADPLNLNDAKNVTSFSGTAGGNNINFVTDQSVDVASGNATIKPHGSTFTSLTATPDPGVNFTDFSTRGQLQAAGSVTLTVTDQNGVMSSHTFTGIPANQDFTAIEVIAVAGSGETNKTVEVSSAGFKELKQEAFGFATATVPEPASLIMAAVPASLLGLVLLRRRMRG